MAQEAGAADASVGRTSWEGGKRNSGRLTALTPSAPPLRFSWTTKCLVWQLSGGTLVVTSVKRPGFRCPLPSLFNTHEERPKLVPFQLVLEY